MSVKTHKSTNHAWVESDKKPDSKMPYLLAPRYDIRITFSLQSLQQTYSAAGMQVRLSRARTYFIQQQLPAS
jgi:hypothetical protein